MTSYAHDNSHLADIYDRLSNTQFEAGQHLCKRLGLRPGDRVLDVGCGTGRLACWVAEQLGDPLAVVGIDPLPERIAIAKEKAPGIRFEVGHAENLTAFANESFDAVCLSAVFHWVPDKPSALAEMARVLRPAGRLGLTTTPRELHMAGTMSRVCGPVFARSPYRDHVRRDGFVMVAQSPTLTELITMILDAGLELGELHVVRRSRLHASEFEVIDFVEASSFGNFLSMVPENLRPCLRHDLAEAFTPLKDPEGITVRDYGTMLIATRP